MNDQPKNETATLRIQTFDLLRGYLLLVILVDHVYKFPGFFEFFTGRGELWVSAAEGFFLISGIAIGFTNFSYQKLWRRSARLYLWSISLTLLYTSIAHLTQNTLPIKPGLLEHVSTWSLLWQTITLRYSYGWADFLNYYVVFLLGAPLVLLLLKRSLIWLVLLISIILWLLRDHNFYLAWQILFVVGIVVGYYFKILEKQIYSWSSLYKISTYILLCSATLITIVISTYAVFITPTFFEAHYNITTTWFDKTTLASGRLLLSLVWFATFIIVIRRHENILTKHLGWLLLPIGRHSLFTYIFQSALVYAYFILFSFPTTFATNFLINLSGLCAVWLAAIWHKKRKTPYAGSLHYLKSLLHSKRTS